MFYIHSQNKKGLIIIFAAVLFVGGFLYLIKSEEGLKQRACTMEAKICPDGTAVVRSGPKCEFAKCPEENGGAGNGVGEFWGTILGTVLLGPVCPVEMIPPDPDCADRPFETRLVLTTSDQSRVIKEFDSSKNGKFRVEVPPGEYAIRSAAAANIMPYCSTNDPIVLKANSYVETTVFCDSGIR